MHRPADCIPQTAGRMWRWTPLQNATIRVCMKRLYLITLAALAAPAPAAERGYSVSDFDNVRVTGPFAVTVVPGRATTVKARGNSLAMEGVSVDVQDGVLIIQPVAASVSSAARADLAPVAIFVVTPRLSSGRLLGSGTLSITDMRGPQVDISLTGSGTVSVTKLAADKLNIRQSGAGQIVLSGKALSADANAKGSGGIDSSALIVADLKLNAASSGNIRMAATRSATGVSSGSGSVLITGKPACAVQNLGSGQVKCGN